MRRLAVPGRPGVEVQLGEEARTLRAFGWLRRWRLAFALVASFAAAPGVAVAAAVPGATYRGTGADGATISFTVSSSGTTVTSYTVLGIFGTDHNGQSCQGTANLNPTGWTGATITNDTFANSSISDFQISGSFGASSTASGTFDLEQAPLGASAGCSTGAVGWTATTTSSQAASGGTGPTTSSGGGAGGGGTGGGTNAGGAGSGSVTQAVRSVAVHLRLRRASTGELTGSLNSNTSACAARRAVYLWSGRRLLSTRTADRKGSFRFALPSGWLGRRLHVSVRALSKQAETCLAASSIVIRA